MQLVVYAFCGLHSLNVLLLPGYMVSTTLCISFLRALLWVSVFRSFRNRILRESFLVEYEVHTRTFHLKATPSLHK